MRNKIYTVLIFPYYRQAKGVTVTQTSLNCIDLWKGLPKESVIETIPRTTGSPKGKYVNSNSYGDRVPIVLRYKHILERGTEYSANNTFNVGFGETRRFFSYNSTTRNNLLSLRGISTELNKRCQQNNLSQENATIRIDLTILKKLADLNSRTQKYPQAVIDRNIYSMMLDKSIY